MKVLEEMIQLGHTPGSFTYTTSIDALCRLYERMIEVGCFRSVQTCNMLISMFFEMGDVDGAFEAWHEMDKRGCAQDVVDTCILMLDRWAFQTLQ
jgi:pentatricopeptide repeat protein